MNYACGDSGDGGRQKKEQSTMMPLMKATATAL